MTASQQERVPAIDQFRGFAIILMVWINYASGIKSIPAWLKHVPDIGMHFPDLGAPVFLFAISLTYSLSFQRRRKRVGLPSGVLLGTLSALALLLDRKGITLIM